MTVTLSTGEKVYFKDRFTHGMHRAMFKAVNKGVTWKQSLETGEYEKEIPAENVELQYEAVFPLVVERIEGGKTPHFTEEWMDDLSQADYRSLEEGVAQIKLGNTVTDEAGKKNP